MDQRIAALLRASQDCTDAPCVETLLAALAEFPEDADKHYALGCCYYLHPHRMGSPLLRRKVEAHPAYEVEDLWPRELVRALEWWGKTLPGHHRQHVRAQLAALDERGRLRGWLVETLDGPM